MSKILSKQDILNSRKPKKTLIEVPEWGGSVYIKHLTASIAIEFSQLASDKTLNMANTDMNLLFVIKLLAFSIIDEDENQLFTEDEIKIMLDTEFIALTGMIDKILCINGMSEQAVKDTQNSFLAIPK